jgi:nucleoside-diphosphate-sugar epimerase
MRIFLTGAYGNVGFSTVKELLSRQHDVHTFDLPTRENQGKAQSVKTDHLTTHWGDIREKNTVYQALQTAKPDVVIHLASIIPPTSDEHPELARGVNVDGTRHMIDGVQVLNPQPHFLLASTFDLYGRTLSQEPPRKTTDPISVSDDYTSHKYQAEEWIRESGLTWSIFRFSNIPLMALRDPHPIMFEITLNTRTEVLHTEDAGLAIANGIESPEIWGKVWNIGGGKSCQVTHAQYVNELLIAMGLGVELPAEAFTTDEHWSLTDWLDTTESQALLQYQRHSFEDIVKELAQIAGWKRYAAMAFKPIVRRNILKLSRYYNK